MTILFKSISTKTTNPLFLRVGGFFFLVLLGAVLDSRASSFAQPHAIPSYCLTGFQSVEIPGLAVEAPSTAITPEVMEWLRQRGWLRAYQNWWRMIECSTSGVCSSILNMDVPQKDVAFTTELGFESKSIPSLCKSKKASLAFLAMHRHLLQSIKSLWPSLKESDGHWQQFPLVPEDYPEADGSLLYAWSDEVRVSAKRIDKMMMMSQSELLKQWPSETDFAHWLVCGDSKELGLSKNALFGALTGNGVQEQKYLLEQELYWRALDWLDRAWNKYRMRIGLMPADPELQGAIITQCRVFDSVTQRSLPLLPASLASNQSSGALYIDGSLSRKRIGETTKILAKVELIEEDASGQIWLKIDPQRMGVKSFWATGRIPLAIKSLKENEMYLFDGEVQRISDTQSEKYSKLTKGSIYFLIKGFYSPK